MRKLLVILFLIPLISKSQLLSSVTQIASYNNPFAQLIIVNDTVRGGQFMPYAGTDAADSGIIFTDANGRKWKRALRQDEGINIAWYGAAASQTATNNRNYVIKARDYIYSHGLSKMIVPKGNYQLSDSILFDKSIVIEGEGNESKLIFAAHKTGIVFSYPGSQYSKLKNISILGDANTINNPLLWDISKHGVVVKSPVDFDGVWVRYFDGCGIYIVNDLTSPTPGNSNTSVFNDCHVYQNILHGIYIKGGDANAMTFTNCDIVSNGGVGIYDKSFLGNNYAYNHIASNGSPELAYQRGLVKSGGTVYACIKDTTIGVAPPNATYWQDLGTSWLSYPSVLDYNAATTYYCVSSIILEGLNQYGTSTSNYIESDQAPAYIDQNNLNINGNIQTRNTTPTTIYANSGKIKSKASFVGEYGVSSSWLYGGDMADYINGYTAHPNYSGLVVGGNSKSSLIKFYDNFTNIGQFYTSTNTLNTFLESGKKYVVTADTVNVVGKLLNNGSELSGSGVSQSTLNDSTAALRAALQPAGNYASGVTNTGDNAPNTTYANDYRAANFVAGTDYLAPNGNGSSLTGLTKTQVGLANVDNTSDANKPISTATQTALDGKQATLVSNTNIKTVGGQSVLGSGNIVTTNSQTFVPLANNFSSTSTAPAAVTGWSFAVTSGVTYRIQVIGAYQTAATTTGGVIGISLTGATGTVRGSARGAVVSTAAATELVIGIVATSGSGSTLTTTGVTAINSPHAISMDIIFTCTGTGTFNIVWGTEVNASAAQLNQNSALIYQALN